MDAIPLSHPDWISSSRLREQKIWLFRKSAHWADHIITLSEFSKTEIAKYFGISENRISVTPLGVDDRYFERLSGFNVESIVAKYSLLERYFIFIGTFQPRKNLDLLIAAHEALPPKAREEYPLMMVGRSGWGCSDLIARLSQYPPGGLVRWLQNVGDLEK